MLKHPKGVYGLAVSPVDGSLATGCNDEDMRVWRPSIMQPAAPTGKSGPASRGAGGRGSAARGRGGGAARGR